VSTGEIGEEDEEGEGEGEVGLRSKRTPFDFFAVGLFVGLIDSGLGRGDLIRG